MGPNELLFFSLFILFIFGMLLIDLGVFSKKSHVVSFKEAGIWTLVWVTVAFIFFAILYFHGNKVHGVTDLASLHEIEDVYAEHLEMENLPFEEAKKMYNTNMAVEYLTGYLLEYALSMDNIFVILLIFQSFSVPELYYKKVLFWGILGALVMRFIFIFLGSALIIKFSWILYVFGGFLIFSGGKMLKEAASGGEDEKIDTTKHPVVKFVSRYASLFPRYVNDRFFVNREGRWMITPLFVVVLIIEFTDLIFAVDSVPAIFSITKDPYVVFFSNIFAIMGLRSMFFFLANIVHKFHLLKFGLSVLLIFIGVKMLSHHYLEHIGFKTEYSLYIILGVLATSIIASLIVPKKHATPQGH